MNVFRITKEKYASELIASGNPGRWNFGGERVIYCAASRALASLEVLLHTSGEMLAQNGFKISVISIPDIAIEKVRREQLPSHWNGLSSYSITQRIGSEWLMSGRSAVLQVPSSIVIQEFNYIINVNHPDFRKFIIHDIEDYICDPLGMVE